MTANAKPMKRARVPGTLEGIRPGESLEEFEKRVGDDIPEWTEAEFKRAVPTGKLPPEMQRPWADAPRKPPRPEEPIDVSPPAAVRFDKRDVHISLEDGRELTVPLTWYPNLVTASPAQRQTFLLTADGVNWPELGETASVAHILRAQQKIETLQRARGQRGPQKAPVKDRIGLRLDHAVVEYFRSTGPGWQSRINEVLAEHVKKANR